MLTIYGEHDEATLQQMDKCMGVGDAVAGVLCADGHLGYAHPIGGVVGYPNHISISGVGFDIACGNMAVRLDTSYNDIRPSIKKILEDISSVVSFGVGRINNTKVDHELFEMEEWKTAEVEDLKPMAEAQLGTVGSGNHYVDIFEDSEDRSTWIGVHFGSRGLGHKITTKYLKAVGAKDGMNADPALIEVNSDLGRGYLAGIALGGAYAYAGREWVIEQVRKIIGGNIIDSVHNHHNFVWKENHFGQDLWVVRKGATPAFPEQRGFVGGSMADPAVILSGKNCEESRTSMYSTVHGAGRVMSRTEARGKVHRKTGEVIKEPRIDRKEWEALLTKNNVTLIGADLDEAPQAYRRLTDVLDDHRNTVNIHSVLYPRGVIMAGANEFDPYKD